MQFFKKAAVYTAVVAAFLLGSAGVSAADISYHTVQKGDTCYKIAQNYGVELSAVLNANGLTAGEIIYPGRTIVLDGNAKNTPGANYTVKRGDTLYAIATTYGTTTQNLKQANKLNADRIYAGQKILIPSANSGLSQDEIWLMAKMIHAVQPSADWPGYTEGSAGDGRR